MCLVILIHLIYGGFQAFGLLRESVTQRIARASSFIVYSSNTLIVLLFICLYRLCFVVDIKIFYSGCFCFIAIHEHFSFNRVSHSTSLPQISNVQSYFFLKPFSKCPYQFSDVIVLSSYCINSWYNTLNTKSDYFTKFSEINEETSWWFFYCFKY